MDPDITSSPFISPTLSRREFLAGAVASVVTAAFSRNAFAGSVAGPAGSVSTAVVDQARKRAAALVSRLSIEEVSRQLVHKVPALPAQGLARYNYWSEALHGVNVDGPITSFPQPIALGCSWNPELVGRVYTAVSDEARAYHNKKGYGLTFFSPITVNMGLRDPRWGRVGENFSEDPLLVQTLAIEATRAMQGDHPKYLKTIVCAKHYICNDTDSDRDYADAAPDRRSFWEYYTRGFEACVIQGKVFSVMAAYSSLWGVPCPASSLLLTEVLRSRWGFEGYVVSDCDAVEDIYATHHYVQTAPEAAAVAIKAGSDLNCGQTYSHFLMQALEAKLVSEETVRTALTRVLTGRFLLGEFDPPADVPWNHISPDIIEGQPHRDLAREAARQSLVLLKNDNHLLPLQKSNLRKVAIIGPLAGACHLGGYSGRATRLISPYFGIASALGTSIYSGAIPAAEYLSTSNFRGPVVSFSEDGSAYLTSIRNRDWAQYGPIDFTEKTSIEFDLACEADVEITVRLDSLDGDTVAVVQVPATGSMGAWKTVTAPLSMVTGSHFVFVMFASSTARRNFLNLRSFQLLPASAPHPSAVRVTYAPGCTITGPRNQALLNKAVEAAKESDVALVFVGDNRLLSDEGRDRDDLDLPQVQHELVRLVLAANPRTIVVVNTTCPVGLMWEEKNVPAILCSYFAGEQQGNAIADALFGDYNPGGKLCSTWYRDVRQLPNFHDYDIKHGRTYMYLHGDPLYAFGYGLSYTTFSYANLTVDGNELAPGETATISVEITNTGHLPGDEVVQLYVAAPGKQQRPNRQLAGFRRVSLQADEKQTVSFVLPHDHLALRYWDDSTQQFTFEPGTVGLLIGSSSADIRLQGQLAFV